MNDEGFVDEALLRKVPRWRNYLAAKLGFRNHWYPVKFSREIDENQVVQAKVLGEEILLKRIDGKVHAIRDRCIHRGVKFSHKIECYTRNTITCWYHGFTYKWDSGNLCDVISSPKSGLIGRKAIKTYPVEEAKGLVFVFVGDEDYAVPALSTDVPPFFLDDGMHVMGFTYTIGSNWRIACENGMDALHLYLHRSSPLIGNTQRSLPLGNLSAAAHHTLFEEDGKAKGIGDFGFTDTLFTYEGFVEGKPVVQGTKNHLTPEEAVKRRVTGSFVSLPGALRVDNFPFVGLTQFEWYVPIDADNHLYIITIGKRCTDDDDKAEFEHEFWHRWKPVSLEGFNNEDVMAREAAQEFYQHDANWLEETLAKEDGGIVAWRELCHRNGRTVQTPRHII